MSDEPLHGAPLVVPGRRWEQHGQNRCCCVSCRREPTATAVVTAPAGPRPTCGVIARPSAFRKITCRFFISQRPFPRFRCSFGLEIPALRLAAENLCRRRLAVEGRGVMCPCCWVWGLCVDWCGVVWCVVWSVVVPFFGPVSLQYAVPP